MLRNPETAYLVSDEEFDRQLDELGWSPDAMANPHGHVWKWACTIWKRISVTPSAVCLNCFCRGIPAYRYGKDLLSGCIVHPWSHCLCLQCVGRFPVHAQPVVHTLHFRLSVASVSDLFSCMLAKIQVLMLQNDILELQNNPNYSLDNSNSVYVIFMLIGIIGYFTVPTVAGWIVQAGGAETTTATSTVPRPRPEDLQRCRRFRTGKYRRRLRGK